MSKQEQIKQYMEKLQISEEEATQLWEDDQEDYIGEDGEEMTKKAKEIKRYEKSAEPKTERKPREIKKDDVKIHIVKMLCNFLQGMKVTDNIDNVIIKNEQKEITFQIGNDEYSVTLTKHRAKKEK